MPPHATLIPSIQGSTFPPVTLTRHTPVITPTNQLTRLPEPPAHAHSPRRAIRCEGCPWTRYWPCERLDVSTGSRNLSYKRPRGRRVRAKRAHTTHQCHSRSAAAGAPLCPYPPCPSYGPTQDRCQRPLSAFAAHGARSRLSQASTPMAVARPMRSGCRCH